MNDREFHERQKMTDTKKTKLVIYPAPQKGDYVYTLCVLDTGEALASHLCSSQWYAEGDLYTSRPERVAEWAKRFGEVEIEFFDESKTSVEEFLERNRNFYKESIVDEVAQ